MSDTHILHESRTKLPDFAEACFFAENIDHYANLKGTDIPQKYEYLAITDPNTVDSTTILNGLRGHGAAGQNFFQDVPKSIAGDFQPWIKIYKTIPGTSKKDHDSDIVIPLKFNNLKNLSIMDSHKLGVAFRSFSFDFEGIRPVEVDSYLRCSLKLYFESPRALFKNYTHKGKNDTYTYSFADLIRRSVRAGNLPMDKQHLVYDGTSFRIRVDVGYTPPSIERLTEAYREAGFDNPKAKARNLRSALLSNKLQLYLNLLKHSINPIYDAPDGGFELTADYVGAIETSFKSKKSDILFTPTDHNARKKEMALREMESELRNQLLEGINETARNKINAFADNKSSFKKAVTDIVKQYAWEPVTSPRTKEAGAPGRVSSGTARDLTGLSPELTGQSATEVTGFFAKQVTVNNRFFYENSEPATELEKARVIRYLEYLDEKNSRDVGQTIVKAKKMSRMYSQILDRLTEKNQLHFIQIKESILYTWFGARKVKEAAKEDKDRLQEVNDEIAELETETGNNSADKLADLKQEKRLLEESVAAAARAPKTTGEPPAVGTSTADSESYADSEQAVDNAAKTKALETATAEGAIQEEKPVNEKIPHTEMEQPAKVEDRNIYFFYYGDLLDVVLEMLYQHKDDMDLDWWSIKNKTGNIKFLLGEVEFKHPQTGALVKENLARIPITLKVWQEFWIENVIDQWRTEYLFDSFLNDTLSQLVVEAITGRCKEEGNINVNVLGYPSYITIPNISNKISFSKNRVGNPKKNERDEAYYYSYGQAPESPHRGGASNDAKKLRTGELVYVQAASNSGLWFKDKATDIRRGVYHIELGRENSTILNFTMNRSNQPHYLEAKLESQGINDVHAFGEPYNYDITMYGNSLLLPGKHLKVSFPYTWFNKKEQNSLGIGGYCLVLKTKNEVKATEARLDWTTNMQCIWQSFGGGSPPIAQSGFGTKPFPGAAYSGVGAISDKFDNPDTITVTDQHGNVIHEGKDPVTGLTPTETRASLAEGARLEAQMPIQVKGMSDEDYAIAIQKWSDKQANIQAKAASQKENQKEPPPPAPPAPPSAPAQAGQTGQTTEQVQHIPVKK